MKARAEHLAGYAWGLLVALVDDYTLITLLIFSVLLGFATSALIAATTFFGAYFVLRLVVNIGEAITYSGVRQAVALERAAHPAYKLQGQDVWGQDPSSDLLP